MKACIRCGAEMDDACHFCQKCGMQQPDEPVNAEPTDAPAPEVSAPVEAAPVEAAPVEAAPVEAAPVEAAPAEAAPAEAAFTAPAAAAIPNAGPVYTQPAAPTKKKKSPVALFIIIGVLVLALIVVGIVAAVKLGGKSGSSYEDRPLVYITDDNELYFAELGSTEPVLINDDYDDYDVFFSNDYKYIAYLALDEDDWEYDLFVRNVDNVKPNKLMEDDRGLKIASGVSMVSFSDNSKYIFYVKDNGALYLYNWEDSEKIASSVNDMLVHGNTVGYLKGDYDSASFYTYDASDKKAEPQKILKDVGYDYYVKEDFSTIIYGKHYSDSYYYEDFPTCDVYIYTEADGSQKVASDVRLYGADPETGKVLYAKDGESAMLSEFINDDMKASDAAMVEPNSDDYEDFWDYWDALDEYDDKERRDTFRDEMNDVVVYNTYDLYLYTGKGDDTLIASGISDLAQYDFEKDYYLYLSADFSDTKKLDISEISRWDLPYPEYIAEDYDLISSDALTLMFKAGKNDAVKITDDFNYYSDIAWNPDNIDELYYSVYEDYYDDEFSIFYVNLNNGKPEKAVTVCDDAEGFGYFSSGRLMFYKDYDYSNGCATLYAATAGVAEKLVKDCDISSYGFEFVGDDLYYISDMDPDNWCGDFNVLTADGKENKIESDVFGFDYRNSKCIYIEKDYDRDDDTASLYLYNGKESVLIAEDVDYVY